MIGSLNHIAIAVPDLDEAMAKYSGPLGAKVGQPQNLVEHGVTIVFIDLPNTKIELKSCQQQFATRSEIKKWLLIHHF